MDILPIVTYDDHVLRQKAERVEEDTKSIQQLIDAMFETMYNADGVGLAAPQIGKPLRIFVADADVFAEKDEDPEPSYGPITMINPSIRLKSEDTIAMEEGCLSIPDVMGPVSRPEKITVEFLDRDFKPQKLDVDGHLARIIQHEIDHLDGILFIDHLSYFKRKLVTAKLNALAAGQKEIAYPVVPKMSA